MQQCIDGYRKQDPVSQKKLPVEANVPKYLVKCAFDPSANELHKAVGDLSLIAFYYLLRVGEYTTKGKRDNSEQTIQFKMEDVQFFAKDRRGQLRCLPHDASDDNIGAAAGMALKLDNQKNGWKGVSIYHETDRDPTFCPVKAIGQRYIYIRANGGRPKTYLSTYFKQGTKYNVMANHISKGLKMAAAAFDYPSLKGIPIDRIDTHSLCSGGANALALSGYSDMQIQKMGRWKGARFKKYIREELACFSTGMSTAMKAKFGFVNVMGSAFHDITSLAIASNYNTTIALAA